MEVSVQLHKPLHPKGRSSWYSLKYKARWAPELVWTFGEDKNLSPMLDIKSHPAHSLLATPNELSLFLNT